MRRSPTLTPAIAGHDASVDGFASRGRDANHRLRQLVQQAEESLDAALIASRLVDAIDDLLAARLLLSTALMTLEDSPPLRQPRQ